jgi:glycosyltransferase involved in cell wall biosynthesis
MKKYKILFITYTHSNGGGVENLLTNLVNNLNPNFYDIDIIEVQGFSVKKEPINNGITLLRPFVKYRSAWTCKAIKHILYYRPEIIKNLFRLYNYDIVITWNNQLPSFCLRAFKNEVKIAWFHGAINDLLCDESDEKACFLRKLQFQAWSNADRIAVVSQKSFQSLSDIYPSLRYKTKIMLNGSDLERIQRLSRENLPLELPLNFNSNIIACIGRLDKNKNFQLLIRAVSKTIISGINCCLLILGDGELRHELEALALEEGLTGRVFFAGYQSNPYPFIKKIKILCITSFSEGFSISALEAMTLGKPFVTTPVAGASEELAGEQMCGLVSGWDVDEYSACIKKLLTDDNIYTSMSRNCVIRAQDFSIERYAANFENLINEVTNSAPRNIDLSVNTGEKAEKRNRFAEFKAVLYFTLSYSLLAHHKLWRDGNVLAAYRRLKIQPSALNMIKFMYRFLRHTIFEILVFPFTFFIALVKGANFGKNNQVIQKLQLLNPFPLKL